MEQGVYRVNFSNSHLISMIINAVKVKDENNAETRMYS